VPNAVRANGMVSTLVLEDLKEHLDCESTRRNVNMQAMSNAKY